MKCKRCNGLGYFKTINLMDGKCFKCDGHGDVEVAKQVRAKEAANSEKNYIIELKQQIAIIYRNIQNSKSVVRNNQRREEAKAHYKELKKRGITFTLEEIKELANNL